MPDNFLYYGDNLDILRRYVKDDSVDLVYLDPPFNSNATYNVLFAEQDGTRAAAQIKAFEDTWQWDQSASEAYMAVIESGHRRVADAMIAFRTFLGDTDMLAYLAMMAPRLIELWRVLRPTGSIYLHCDVTASHYLKMLMDAVFGPENFRSDIVWQRTVSHGNAARSFPDVTDILLYYSKSDQFHYEMQYLPYSEEYLATKYRHVDSKGRQYRLDNLRNPGVRPNLTYDYKGFKPHPNGWAISLERMKELDAGGRLEFPKKPDGRIQLRRYLDEMPGVPVSNMWTDIRPINSMAQERLGYPTQKPEALLERILKTSSQQGDLVLDPFCGCGTAIATSQRLNRNWIGIDITHLAIGLIKHRLKTAFADVNVPLEYKVIGEPTTMDDARILATDEPFQFQAWALGLVGARTASSAKKGADKGIDGRLYFHDDDSGKTKQIIFQVKAGGNVTAAHVRDLRGVIEREKAAIGVLIVLDKISSPMKAEAASADFYDAPGWGKFPRLQVVSVGELLKGATIKYPPTRANVTLKKAGKAAVETDTGRLF